MFNVSDAHKVTKGTGDLVLRCQIRHPDPETDGEASNEQRTVTQVEAWLEEQRQQTPPHPLQEELASIQQALDALEACPPLWWAEGMFWRGLRWFLRRRLRRTQAAWEASVVSGQASAMGKGYDFEPEMILIPGGKFLMGSDPQKDKDARGLEQPQSAPYLADYYLAKTAVTNAQYAAFVQAAGHIPPRYWENAGPPRGKENHPVVGVSWYDAVAYCHWLSTVTGKPYRLPTEAEWEKAARGTAGRIYPWGDQWDAKRCNTKEGGKGDTTPVGAHPQGISPYGLMDMSGNVWEWTSSLYWDYPYRGDDGRENAALSDSRVLRGGSWLNQYDSARTAYRRSYTPAYHSRIHGFRCCVSL